MKNSPADAGDVRDAGSMPGRSPRGGNGITHSSVLAWKIPWTEATGGLHTVHGVARRQRPLSEHTQEAGSGAEGHTDFPPSISLRARSSGVLKRCFPLAERSGWGEGVILNPGKLPRPLGKVNRAAVPGHSPSLSPPYPSSSLNSRPDRAALSHIPAMSSCLLLQRTVE